MTGFVNRINTANQSVDRNTKLPAILARKRRCDPVETIKKKLSDGVFAQWQRSWNREKCKL